MNEYLEHYGVRGMKWGQHKAQAIARKQNRLAKKRDKLWTKADKKFEYASNRKVDWGNKGRHQLHYAMKAQKKANKIMKRTAKLDVKSDRILSRAQAVEHGKKYVSERYKINYIKDNTGRITSYEVVKKPRKG